MTAGRPEKPADESLAEVPATELEHELGHDVTEAAGWVWRNPHAVAWMVHLLMGSIAVTTQLVTHDTACRILATVIAVVASWLAQTTATDKTTPLVDPRDDGAELAPKTWTTPESTQPPASP